MLIRSGREKPFLAGAELGRRCGPHGVYDIGVTTQGLWFTVYVTGPMTQGSWFMVYGIPQTQVCEHGRLEQVHELVDLY
jgi:hypothetical protein